MNYEKTRNKKGGTLEEDLGQEITITKKEVIEHFCKNLETLGVEGLDVETVMFELQDGYKDIENYSAKDIVEILAGLTKEYLLD